MRIVPWTTIKGRQSPSGVVEISSRLTVVRPRKQIFLSPWNGTKLFVRGDDGLWKVAYLFIWEEREGEVFLLSPLIFPFVAPRNCSRPASALVPLVRRWGGFSSRPWSLRLIHNSMTVQEQPESLQKHEYLQKLSLSRSLGLVRNARLLRNFSLKALSLVRNLSLLKSLGLIRNPWLALWKSLWKSLTDLSEKPQF